MLRYIINRIVYLIPVMLIISLVVFSFMHLIPGDPVDYILGTESTPEARDALRKELGLDRNITIQYISWASKLLMGDFGKSVVSKQQVLKSILEKLPASAMLAITAVTVSTLLALFLGTVAATRHGSMTDFIALILALFWVSIPAFWLGILMILLLL